MNVLASGKIISCNYAEETSDSKFNGYAFVDKALLFSTLEQCLCCYICQSEISADCEVKYGLIMIVNISCVSCGFISSVQNLIKVGGKKNA